MMDQLALFDDAGAAFARWSDPDTSHDAAESLDDAKITRLEGIVLFGFDAELLHRGTREEIVDAAEPQWRGVIPALNVMQTLSPRFKPLALKGKIRDTGERLPLRSGKLGIVWERVYGS